MNSAIHKLSLAIFFVTLLSANILNAQDTVIVEKQTVVHDSPAQSNEARTLLKNEFGLRFLPTFTSMSFRNSSGDIVRGSTTMSNGFGVMLAHNCNSVVGYQVEFNYEQIFQKYKDMGLDREVNINYINIPIQLMLSTDKKSPVVLTVVAGPQLGINVGSSFKSGTEGSSTDTLHAVLAVKHGDVGIAYGAGLGVALNHERTIRLDFGFRGSYGLVDMSGEVTGNNTFNILVKGSRKANGGYFGIAFLF